MLERKELLACVGVALGPRIKIAVEHLNPAKLVQGRGIGAGADRPGLAEEVGELGPDRGADTVGCLLEQVDKPITDEVHTVLADHGRRTASQVLMCEPCVDPDSRP